METVKTAPTTVASQEGSVEHSVEGVISPQPIDHSTPAQQPTTYEDESEITLDSIDTPEVQNDKIAQPNDVIPDISSTSDSFLMDATPQKEEANVLLIGGTNCRGIKIKGDEEIDFDVVPLIQGGLIVEEAAEKLEECDLAMKEKVDAVIVHVGSCNFPVNDYQDMHRLYTHYVELLTAFSSSCPKANIVISSVPPRVWQKQCEHKWANQGL